MTDPEVLPETNHFGLTRIGETDSMSKNGWAALDSDRIRLDDLLQAAIVHTHDGTPALGDPSDPPTLVVEPSGGELPAASSFYYRVSFVDEHNLETAASPEEVATTDDPIAEPAPPAATVITGGTLDPGLYAYVITQVDSLGGETTPSGLNNVRVEDGLAAVLLDLPDLAIGAVGTRIYRARPGQTVFYQVGATTTVNWTDNGDPEDQSVTAPLDNTTNSANAIQVTIPLDFIPLGCVSWKIYRATFSGGYDGSSLVHHVVESADDISTIPVLVWTDTGDVLQQGFPLNSSSTIPSAPVISLDQIQGSLPLDVIPRGAQCLNAFGSGAIGDTVILTATDTAAPMRPTRFTAYFQTPPDGSSSVLIRVQDAASNFVDLLCSAATHQGGDPAGYYRIAYPLTSGGEYQAEGGQRSADAVVINDTAAVSGRSVEIDNLSDWVEISLGVLDAGDYTSSAKVRVLNYHEATVNDLLISAIRTDTDATLASVTYTPGTGGHPESTAITSWPGPAFTAPGGEEVVIRVTKNTTSVQTYNVDSMRADVAVPALVAGQLTMTTYTEDGPTVAADVNVALWF